MALNLICCLLFIVAVTRRCPVARAAAKSPVAIDTWLRHCKVCTAMMATRRSGCFEAAAA